MSLLDQYQSIADTIVQLFPSCPSVVIASPRPASIAKCTTKDKGDGMNRTSAFSGGTLHGRAVEQAGCGLHFLGEAIRPRKGD
jgi:hypothetical protein